MAGSQKKVLKPGVERAEEPSKSECKKHWQRTSLRTTWETAQWRRHCPTLADRMHPTGFGNSHHAMAMHSTGGAFGALQAALLAIPDESGTRPMRQQQQQHHPPKGARRMQPKSGKGGEPVPPLPPLPLLLSDLTAKDSFDERESRRMVSCASLPLPTPFILFVDVECVHFPPHNTKPARGRTSDLTNNLLHSS